MQLPLVVGVDGSESSLQAVDWAVDEAARHQVPLRLVYASVRSRHELPVPVMGTQRPSEQVLRDHIVGSATERANRRNPAVKLSSEILPESATAALLDEGRNALALVTGSRGRGGFTSLLLGSVSLSVAARADCPVIVVRGPEDNRAGHFHQVTLGVGDTPRGPEDSAAVRFAFHEAQARDCVLHAVRTWRCPAHESVDHPLMTQYVVGTHEEQAAAALENALRAQSQLHAGVVVRRETAEGAARKVLLEKAPASDLLIVGAHRRKGHLGLQLGPVSHALLHHADCPVAIVPEHI